jgi:hypothetical protein
MRGPRGFAAPLFLAGLALTGVMAAAPAGSAELRPLPVPGVQYCAAVIGHLPGADAASPAHGRACSPDYWADAITRSEALSRG